MHSEVIKFLSHSYVFSINIAPVNIILETEFPYSAIYTAIDHNPLPTKPFTSDVNRGEGTDCFKSLA